MTSVRPVTTQRDDVVAGLRAALDVVAKGLSQPQHEESIIRPLCLRLGYLTGAEVNLFHHVPTDEEILSLEGTDGGVELCHRCGEEPSKTKYQVLFSDSPWSTKYRRSLF